MENASINKNIVNLSFGVLIGFMLLNGKKKILISPKQLSILHIFTFSST